MKTLKALALTILIGGFSLISAVEDTAWARGGGGGGGRGGSRGSSSSYSRSSGRVNVRGYVRKDGTSVSPYTRSGLGSGSTTTPIKKASGASVSTSSRPTTGRLKLRCQVRVKAYVRKDGTSVASYTRSAAGLGAGGCGTSTSFAKSKSIITRKTPTSIAKANSKSVARRTSQNRVVQSPRVRGLW